MLEALAALAKLLLYAGALAGAGAAFASVSLGHLLGSTPTLAPLVIRAGAALATFGALAHVFVLILRLGGDFSGPTLSAVLESPTGIALALQLVGSFLLLIFASAGGIGKYVYVLGGATLVVSFGVNGHAASINLMSGAIAFAHVGATAWWFGALLLLRPACRALKSAELVNLVRRFSAHAMMIVGGLVLAGGVLIFTLVDFGRPDWFTPYAQILAIKVALAASLLGLAAYNKLILTPELGSEDGRTVKGLRRSITLEIGLIVGVLGATAALTTYTSPHT